MRRANGAAAGPGQYRLAGSQSRFKIRWCVFDWQAVFGWPWTLKTSLRAARRIAINAVPATFMILPASPPYCHSCGGALIGRDWYDITAWHLSDDGCCAECGMRRHGVFEKMAGRWGRRCQPVRLCAFEREAMAL